MTLRTKTGSGRAIYTKSPGGVIQRRWPVQQPDTQAPTSPTGLLADAGDSRVDLFWSESTDNVSVTGYRIYQNGSLLEDIGYDQRYSITELTNGTQYTFGVTAYDAAYNESVPATIQATPVAPPPPDTGGYVEPASVTRSWYGTGLTGTGAITTSLTGPNSPTDDPFSAVANGPTYSVDEDGLVWMVVPNSTAGTQCRYNDNAYSDWQFREYIEVGGANPTDSTAPIIYGTKTSGGRFFTVVVSTLKNLNFMNTANGYVRQTDPLPDGRYRIELFRSAGSSIVEVRIYNAATGASVYSNNFETGVLATDTLDDLIVGRQSGAAFGPWKMGGFALGTAAAEVGPHPDYEVIVDTAQYRDITEYPFDPDAGGPWLALQSTVGTFAPTSGDAAYDSWKSCAGNPPPVGSDSAGQLNWQEWTVKRTKCKPEYGLVTLRRPNAGTTWYTLRIDPNFTPSGPSNGDRNTVVIGEDGVTAYDVFKFTWISPTVVESSSVDVYRLDGPGLQPGVRASSLPLIAGEITKSRLDQILTGEVDDFGMAFAASIPRTMLKFSPTSSDGVVRNGVAVEPATQRDNQGPNPYSGNIAMGALFMIPHDVNLATFNPANLIEWAILKTLQRYGVYITDQSGSVALYAEPGIGQTNADIIKNFWRAKGIGACRRATSNSGAGAYGNRPSGGATTRVARGNVLLPIKPGL